MASFAVVSRVYMICWFTCRIDTIMAAVTLLTHELAVIEAHDIP